MTKGRLDSQAHSTQLAKSANSNALNEPVGFQPTATAFDLADYYAAIADRRRLKWWLIVPICVTVIFRTPLFYALLSVVLAAVLIFHLTRRRKFVVYRLAPTIQRTQKKISETAKQIEAQIKSLRSDWSDFSTIANCEFAGSGSLIYRGNGFLLFERALYANGKISWIRNATARLDERIESSYLTTTDYETKHNRDSSGRITSSTSSPKTYVSKHNLIHLSVVVAGPNLKESKLQFSSYDAANFFIAKFRSAVDRWQTPASAPSGANPAIAPKLQELDARLEAIRDVRNKVWAELRNLPSDVAHLIFAPLASLDLSTPPKNNKPMPVSIKLKSD